MAKALNELKLKSLKIPSLWIGWGAEDDIWKTSKYILARKN